MHTVKSLDEVTLVVKLLRDFNTSHGVVFNTRSLRLTTQKVVSRVNAEGISFLTKTLPKLGKALDRALSSNTKLTVSNLKFSLQPETELPIFMGEFFSRVFDKAGMVLPDPCADSVRVIRQLCYLFYKYELPYTDEQEQIILDRFIETEEEVRTHSDYLRRLATDIQDNYRSARFPQKTEKSTAEVAREARILLWELFRTFDPKNIWPAHGPGAVSTREKLWDKYSWSVIPGRIAEVYPIDEYFYTSLGHVCDDLQHLYKLGDGELSARVILVPKDSRGPRLISCEPLAFQWVQQGLGEAIVRHVEDHELSKFNVFFTDQGPNQKGALLGSLDGSYATLDLNEASDRVNLELVRLLFPEPLLRHLEACRSLSTQLPNGQVLMLQKYAPMGSALCFPVMALCIWSILTAAAVGAVASPSQSGYCNDNDHGVKDRILVYGDDVIVPTAFADRAIELLESFGLKINRDKSCTKGLFRESCGMDAFKGANVTPIRIRTVWSSEPRPSVYASWIKYANSFYKHHYFNCYDYIVENLHHIYGEIPSEDMLLGCPSLVEVADQYKPKRRRINKDLQKVEWYVTVIRSRQIKRTMNGWSMLLRYFTEGRRHFANSLLPHDRDDCVRYSEKSESFSASVYTRRKASVLAKRWR